MQLLWWTLKWLIFPCLKWSVGMGNSENHRTVHIVRMPLVLVSEFSSRVYGLWRYISMKIRIYMYIDETWMGCDEVVTTNESHSFPHSLSPLRWVMIIRKYDRKSLTHNDHLKPTQMQVLKDSTFFHFFSSTNATFWASYEKLFDFRQFFLLLYTRKTQRQHTFKNGDAGKS